YRRRAHRHGDALQRNEIERSVTAGDDPPSRMAGTVEPWPDRAAPAAAPRRLDMECAQAEQRGVAGAVGADVARAMAVPARRVGVAVAERVRAPVRPSRGAASVRGD